MATYVKLGEKAESFFDPFSRLSLAGKDVVLLEGKSAKSNRVKLALKGGHLVHASKDEFLEAGGKLPEKKNVPDSETTKVEVPENKFGKTPEELLKYYTDTFQVTKKDIEAFKKLSPQEMVDELTKLEE